jgi:hypothetical protein
MDTLAIPEQRRRPRAIHLTHAVDIRRAPEDVYRFYVTMRTPRYRAVSPCHERFDVEDGGPLRLGAVIDCRERAGRQEVHHRYVVTELVPNERLAYASTPSATFIHTGGRVLQGVSDTFVYQDIDRTGDGRTRLRSTVVIELPSSSKKLLALATGTRGLWLAHLREELLGARALLEARPAIEQNH